jgi:hypothetical protein
MVNEPDRMHVSERTPGYPAHRREPGPGRADTLPSEGTATAFCADVTAPTFMRSTVRRRRDHGRGGMFGQHGAGYGLVQCTDCSPCDPRRLEIKQRINARALELYAQETPW